MLLLDYWKNIPGFDRHQASFSGYIRHLGKVNQYRGYNFEWVPEQILSPTKDENGYLIIGISEYGKYCVKRVHVFVALTFLANPKQLPEVNHLNAIKDDNRASNLEWCTHKQNMEHASKLGLLKKGKKILIA